MFSDRTATTKRDPVPRATCLTAGCNFDEQTRGLCGTCYGTALKLVRRGRTSWAILERLGLSKPPRGKKPRIVTRFERGMIDKMSLAGISEPGIPVAEEKYENTDLSISNGPPTLQSWSTFGPGQNPQRAELTLV